MRFSVIVFTVLAILPCLSVAGHQHEHRAVTAHQHGVGELTVVMEGKTMQVNLVSPAVNVFGFEHSANTERERQHEKKVFEQLTQSESVVMIKEGGCLLTHYEMTQPFDDKTNDKSSVHTDLNITYSFTCQQPLEISKINLTLFDTFSGFEQINAQWIIHAKPGAAQFDKDHAVINIE
jgi:hypothetical protein